MITKNLVRLPKSQVQVQISVPWVDVEPKWNETLQKMASDAELAGFRKGQAPLPMAEQHLGQKLQDEVLKNVFAQSLVEALQGSGITPIDYPKYNLVSFTKGQQLQFSAIVTNRPQVSVGDYRSIKVARPSTKQVTDENVNKVIDDLFKRWKARGGSVAAQSGVGTGSLSFNSQPNSPQPPVTSGTQPDDVFAKAMGANSLVDLRVRLKQDLESEAKYNNELDYEEVILQEIEKITQVDLPEVLIEDELYRMLVSLQRRVTEMGLILDEYLKGQNETVEGLRAKWRPQAEKNVRMELGLAEVARREGIQITDPELQAEIDKIQDAKLKAQFESQEPRLHLRHSLRQLRTLDFLKSIVKAS